VNEEYRHLVSEGLWNNNVGLVQLLGLCPLLAVTNTTVNGLGLGIATTLVLLTSNVTVSAIRRWITPEIRIPVFVLVIASAVTAIELLMAAWLYDLYRVLGIFVPLIVTNCAIIGRAESFASRRPLSEAAIDGLAMGGGFTAVLVVLGALRELIGHGTLLREAQFLFGEAASTWKVSLWPGDHGLLLAILPPGAFFGLGLLIAIKNLIDEHRARRAQTPAAAAPAAARAS